MERPSDSKSRGRRVEITGFSTIDTEANMVGHIRQMSEAGFSVGIRSL